MYQPQFDANNNVVGFRSLTGSNYLTPNQFSQLVSTASGINTPPNSNASLTGGGTSIAQPASALPARTNTPSGQASNQTAAFGTTERVNQLKNQIASLSSQLTNAPPQSQKFIGDQIDTLKKEHEANLIANADFAKQNFNLETSALTQAMSDHNQARNTIQEASIMRNALVDPNTNKPNINTGPLGPRIQQLAAIAQQAGAPPQMIRDIASTDPSNAALVGKLQTTIGSLMSRQELNGTIRQGEWNRFMQSTPGVDMPTAASVFLLDHIIIPKAQQDINAYNEVKDMIPEQGGIRKTLSDYRAKNPWYSGSATASNPSGVEPVTIKDENQFNSMSADPNNHGKPFIIPSGPNKGKIGYFQ